MIHFETLEDPRQQSKVLHPMKNIVFIVLVGALNGLDGWEEIADFAEYRRDFLEKYLDLSNGIPTDDTLRRFFQNLNPKSFQERFVSWTSSIVHDVDGKVVSIDGKRIRKASEMNDRNPIHIVSAWLAENEMVLGQLKVSEKTNEITAIPQLIEILDLKGSTVTLDAMGCQTNIVEKVVDAGADYVIGLKGNQPTLLEDAELTSRTHRPARVLSTTDCGHGRVEERKYLFYNDLSCLCGAERWKGLQMVVKVETTQTDKKTGKETSDTRYFITSHDESMADRVAYSIRRHWAVESMHWQLDVVFGEDSSLKRVKNSAENFNIVRKIVLGLLKNDGIDYGKKKVSLKRRMLHAIHDEEYLESLLERL